MILCCGEALVDMLPDGDGHDPVLGGSIFNTARVCARLGLRTAYVASLSTDAFGEQLADSLRDSGVSLDYAPRVDRPTALAWVTLNDGQAQYRFEMEGSASQMVTADELPHDVPDCTLAHFGSISLASEPCATAYEQLMHRLATHSTIAMDPNIRPAFIHDRDAQKKRLENLFAITDIVKISDEDLAWFGVDTATAEAEAFAHELLEGRTSLVVITRGSTGVSGYCAAGHVDVPAPKVTVADTVGAGDAFSAGLYHGLSSADCLTRDALQSLSPATLESVLTSGVNVSARVVQAHGAELPA